MSLYSDVNSISPTTAPQAVDVTAVYYSLYNLFNTRKGEALFNPEYGLDVEDSLFELMDDLTALALYSNLIRDVERFEPRVKINTSISEVVAYPDENRYEVKLYFGIVGVSGQDFKLVGSFTP